MVELKAGPDLRINGVGKAAGGEYNDVHIDGVCKVEGHLKARTCDLNGQIRLRGDVVVDHFDCDGMLKVEGRMQAQQAEMDGMITIKGAYDGEQLRLKGMFKVDGDCNLAQFEGEGGFTIDGLLNADRISFNLQSKGKAREIGGESIRIRRARLSRWSKLWTWMLPQFVPELHTDLIEGDSIDLAYTTAAVVRGNQVIIGQGCIIGQVEYRTELHVHPSAQVGKAEKLGD